MHAGLDPHGLAYSGLPYGLQNGGGGLNPLGGSHGLGANPLLTIEQAAAAAAGQLPLSAGLPAGLGGQPNGTAGLPQGGLPHGGDAAAAPSASAASAEGNAANLLSSLSNLSLTDQANLASAAGAAGALQAANALQQAANASANGSDGSGGGDAISEAQAQAQLAAINAGAASALEAALAGRPPLLGGDGAAGLLAAQQVPGDSSMHMWSVECWKTDPFRLLAKICMLICRFCRHHEGHKRLAAATRGRVLGPPMTSTLHILQVLQQQQGQPQGQGSGGQLPPVAATAGSSGEAPQASSPSAAAVLAAGFAGMPASGDVSALAAATSAAAGLQPGGGTGGAGSAAGGIGGSIANGLGSGVTGLAYLGGLAPLGGAGGRLGELPGAPGGGQLPGVPPGAGGLNARGLDHAASQWKLFIGQVPMEVRNY